LFEFAGKKRKLKDGESRGRFQQLHNKYAGDPI